jgi:hypothetical protein
MLLTIEGRAPPFLDEQETTMTTKTTLIALMLAAAAFTSAPVGVGAAFARAMTSGYAHGTVSNSGNATDHAALGTRFDPYRSFRFLPGAPSVRGHLSATRGAGAAKFDEFTIKKTTDSASPQFFKNSLASSSPARARERP